MLNLKHRPKNNRQPGPPAQSAFEQLVREAVEVAKRLVEQGAHDPHKPLSAAAYMLETLKLVRSSPKRVTELRKELEGNNPGLANARGILRRMVTYLRGPNGRNPPTRPERLEGLSNDATRTELAAWGYSTMELFACAVQVCGERHPDLWGTAESSQSEEEERAELKRRQAELFAKIGTSWTPGEVLAEQRDAPPAFKIAPEVPIAPINNAAERLVKALIAKGE